MKTAETQTDENFVVLRKSSHEKVGEYEYTAKKKNKENIIDKELIYQGKNMPQMLQDISKIKNDVLSNYNVCFFIFFLIKINLLKL